MSTAQPNCSLFDNNLTDCEVEPFDNSVADLAFMSIFHVGNFLVGLPANVWVIWLICRGGREQLALEINLLNLAVCEFLYCLGLPGNLYCLYRSDAACVGFSALTVVPFFFQWIGRPIFQTTICVERYIAVVHPLIFIRCKPLKYKVAQSVLAWCFFFVVSALQWTLPPRIIGYGWFVPTLCILLYCYFSVLYSLKRPGPGEKEGQEKGRRDEIKRKAFHMILVHLICFLANYLPLMIARNAKSPDIVVKLAGLGVLCGHVQPLLYLHRAGKLCCTCS